ncbi:HAD family hydrolase [Halogeometricum limi]|uniref:Putative hydrolase of the HAD superfamily n=1 Tax=Halogeometricum limi TaxID=555875 RepID=A0A1I6GIR3_9EURY|nr:HAD family hydrolase [Halogeometricum limi]SFR42082.1 putative hydrolase of the HAD superfamily [Halogeometricum limi]
MTRFDAVLFDLDGTLCRNDQTGADIYFGAFDRAGIDPFGRPSDLWSTLDGPPAADPRERLDYLREGFRSVAERHDRTGVDAGALARGFSEVVDHSAVSLLAGAGDTLAAARERARVGLVTNGPEHRQAVKLASLGLEDAFEVVVFAGDMERRKPHPDPFDRAVSELGVSPPDALYVGNSLQYDVAGAQNAGLPVAWYVGDGGGDADDEDAESYDPDYVLRSLSELVEILDGEHA